MSREINTDIQTENNLRNQVLFFRHPIVITLLNRENLFTFQTIVLKVTSLLINSLLDAA